MTILISIPAVQLLSAPREQVSADGMYEGIDPAS